MSEPPDLATLYQAIDATWPPLAIHEVPGWRVREGAGGGQRVSAATATIGEPEIIAMETEQANLGQVPLVMIRSGEDALDRRLADAGYAIVDPVNLYLAPTERLLKDIPPVTGFQIEWPPLAFQREIWSQAGIGTGRQAVMARAADKVSILGRTDDQLSGTAFAAKVKEIAMLHALEVVPALRRRKSAVHIMRTAAHWAQDAGAHWMAVLVTADNAPANALYTSLGMTVVGHYHYRKKTEPAKGQSRFEKGLITMDDAPTALDLPQVDPLPAETQKYFDVCMEKLGLVPNVLRAYAFDIEKLNAFTGLYNNLMLDDSGLTKLEREMIAVVVSSVNRCFYCLVAHGQAVRELSGDPQLGEHLVMNYRTAPLDDRQRAMLDFAVKLTESSSKVGESDRQILRDHGLSERDIWDVAAVAGFFNMTNRVASAVDMRPNTEYHGRDR